MSKLFKTFIPYIALVAVIMILALVTQIWSEVKEEAIEIQFVSSSN